MKSRTPRGGRDGSRRGWRRLAPVVGVLLILAVPVVLQLGPLLALVYVAFVCLGFALMRGRRAAIPPAPWTCEIEWKPGYVRSRFQAVIVTPDDRRRRVVAESGGLRWPPQDARNPPTREIEAALAALISAIVASGWEPVQSPGSWSQRRFIWRRPGEPPTLRRSRPPHVRGERGGDVAPPVDVPAGHSMTDSATAAERSNVNGGWVGGESEPPRGDECHLEHPYRA